MRVMELGTVPVVVVRFALQDRPTQALRVVEPANRRLGHVQEAVHGELMVRVSPTVNVLLGILMWI